MPLDIRNYNDRMVIRCIFAAITTALSKFSFPPVATDCYHPLSKSRKEVKYEEKNENENTRFEVRLLRDPADTSEAHRPSSREDAGVAGEADTQDPSVANKQGGGHSQEGAGEPQGTLYASDSQEAKTHHSEKSEEEDREDEEGEKYQKREHGEGGSEEQHLEEPGETQNTFLNKINQAMAKKKEEIVSRYNTPSARLPEEKTHSRERSSQESGEETRNQEKHPQESKSQLRSLEEPEESEEDASLEVDKRLLRPRHHHRPSRPDRSYQERNPPSEERGHPSEESESDLDITSLGDRRDHHPTHYRASEEESEYGEVRSYPGVWAPKNLEGRQYGGRGSEEYRAPRPPTDDSLVKKDKRYRPNSELDNMPHRYSEESEEEKGPEWGPEPELGAYSTPDKEEKRFLDEGLYRVQENQMDKGRRHPQGEWKEQGRNDLNYGEEMGEEGAQGKWQQQEVLQDTKGNREEGRLQGKQYAPYHTTEKRKRLGELLNPYYDPSQWKGSHLERKDNMDNNFLEGEVENGLTLNEKNFFPEYNYDWWEKKPFEKDVNWGYEKRNFAPKLDLKRQYDRVAELDQLLHYRKKAAEFPDFYDAEEQMSPHHVAENEKDRAGRGVLTEEEEKELENLAAMDLELQKIAEKFSGNQRG
ncbi:chromogranin B [Rhinolophus ferrumequinum]|nr:chromogranin B [Rhinolophus ferrumequinum]